MMCFYQIALAVCITAISVTNVNSKSLKEFLFGSGNPSSELSDSVRLANQEKEHILSLIEEVQGLAVVLPSNMAWRSVPGVLDTILASEGSLRQDIMLASVAEVPVAESSSWEAVKQRAERNGGVIDTAYGTAMLLRDDPRGHPNVCIAKWNNGRFQEGRCVEVTLDTVLSDATVYRTNELLLPDELADAINNI